MRFASRGTEDIYEGRDTKAARRVCPLALTQKARRLLDQLATVPTLDELSQPPGNGLEALKKDRAGQHAIKINDQYRICFRWNNGDPTDIEIVDYH